MLLALARVYIKARCFPTERWFDKSIPQKQTLAVLNIQPCEMGEEVKRTQISWLG